MCSAQNLADAGDVGRCASAQCRALATQPRTRPAPPSSARAPVSWQRTATRTAARPGRRGATGLIAAPAAAAEIGVAHATASCRVTAKIAALAARARQRKRRRAIPAAVPVGQPGRRGPTVRRRAAAVSESESGTVWWMGSAVFVQRTSSALATSR